MEKSLLYWKTVLRQTVEKALENFALLNHLNENKCMLIFIPMHEEPTICVVLRLVMRANTSEQKAKLLTPGIVVQWEQSTAVENCIIQCLEWYWRGLGQMLWKIKERRWGERERTRETDRQTDDR